MPFKITLSSPAPISATAQPSNRDQPRWKANTRADTSPITPKVDALPKNVMTSNALWLNRELEFSFRSARLQSVVLMVLALDLLSRIASRYGRCGRKVFEANQDPIVSAMQLFECVPFTDVDKILVEPLRAWLKNTPEFDPEGWALPLFERFGPSF